MKLANLVAGLASRGLQRGDSAPQRNDISFELHNLILEVLRNAKAAFYVLNDFIDECIPLLLAKHCPAVLAIVGHSRARLIHASGATTLSDRHTSVNLADGDAFEIHRLQQAQRGFIRNAAAFYIACFAVGYFIAAVVHILTDRSAQW